MEKQKTGDSQRSLFSSFRLVGLGFWQAWWMLVLCSEVIIPTGGFMVDPVTLVLGFSAFGYLAVVVVSRWVSPFLSRPSFLITSALCSFVGTLGMGLVANGTFGEAHMMPHVLFTVILSLGNAWLLIMWGERWSTLATGRVGQFLYVSYAFAFVLFFAVGALPLPAKIIAISTLPVISVLILISTKSEPKREPSEVPFDMEPASIARIVAYLVFMSLAYGVSQSAMTILPSSEGVVSAMFLFSGICIAALALYIFIEQPPVEAFVMYRPILPALAVGLILIAVLPSGFMFIGGSLTIIAAYSLDMLIMLVATDISFRRRIPVALTLGLSIFVARIGTLLGTTGFRFAFMEENVSLEYAPTVLLGCAILVIAVGTLTFSIIDLQKLYRPLPTVKQTESVKEKCDRIAEMCGLTARESEVLLLLASGRSVPYICEELVIAKGTAKHHVSNIYRKVGVYDRQSLHDVIEQGSAGKGAL